MAYSIEKRSVINYPPERLRDFIFYGYEYIDNLHFIQPPDEFIPLNESVDNYLAVVRERFLVEGWDGDGEIGLLWLPPFIFPSALQKPWTGVLVWHVKQLEDGLSWMLSPIELPFEEFTR